MKKHIFYVQILCFILNNLLFAQNVDLVGQLNPYPFLDYADIWGYAAPDGKEYALMGVTGGTVIIDVSDPANPVEIEFIPGPNAPPYEWRDIKTHLNYAYVVTEGSGLGFGMQIIDLSDLPNSAALVNTFDTAFTTSHNLYIDNGFAYVVGTSGGGGMHILDLSDPVNPVQTAYFSGSGYIHDVYVWDDTAYVSGADTYDLVDVSNKSNPQVISRSNFLPGIYAHSGWLTKDKRYFYATDEFNQRDLLVWDLEDRSTWNLIVQSWQMPGSSAIHNLFIKDNYAHISYYVDGYVVLDISDPTNPIFAAQYDTYTGVGGPYNGAWGVYPYLPSGYIIVSDMVTGLYILNFDDGIPVELSSFTATSTGNTVNLNWVTKTETNNLGFELEKTFPLPPPFQGGGGESTGGWMTIGFVNGAGTTTEPQQYSFTDTELSNGTYHYRLKQIDFDGSFNYSEIIEVDVFVPAVFKLEQNYPNPFNPSTKIDFTIPEAGQVTLKVFNIIGEEVAEIVNEFMDAGNYTLNFSASNLPSGIYYVKFTSGNYHQMIKLNLMK